MIGSCARLVTAVAVVVTLGGLTGTAHAASWNQTWGWGDNAFGQAAGPSGVTQAPDKVSGTTAAVFRDVSAGRTHSLAVDTNGDVWAWGSNASGQLGTGGVPSQTSTPVQVPVPASINFVQVAAGGDFSLALDSSGQVWSWGANGSGQLGDGTFTSQSSPGKSKANQASRIAAGGGHGLAIQNGSVWAWGNNASGQLGDGTTTTQPFPRQALAPGNVAFTEVAAGGRHSLALSANKQVWAWGENGQGQLGDGTLVDQVKPGLVPGVAGAIDVAAGDGHSLATAYTTTFAWGENGLGQLGIGATSPPVTNAKKVLGIDKVLEVAAGLRSSAARTSDGSVWTWGNNHEGQLGIPGLQQTTVPKQVIGLSKIIAVSLSWRHVLAIQGV